MWGFTILVGIIILVGTIDTEEILIKFWVIFFREIKILIFI